MAFFSFFLFIFFTLLIMTLQINKSLNSTLQQMNEEKPLFDILRDEGRDMLKQALDSVELSDECKNVFNYSYTFTSDYSDYNLNKLIRDSSINENDITSYGSCMNKKHGYTNYTVNSTFLLSFIKKNTSLLMFGVCAADGCKNEEYAKVIHILGKGFGYFSNETTEKDINVISINKNNDEYIFSWKNLADLVPCFFLLIHFLLLFFNNFSYKILKKIFFSKETVQKREQKHGSNLKKVFSSLANWEELFDLKNESNEINNDSGITYVKGIRGISMCFLVFGFFILNLWNAPVAVITKRGINNTLGSLFFSFFYFGLRYAPKIAYSCSGYCLCYKLLSYLDDYVEENIEVPKERGRSVSVLNSIGKDSNIDELEENDSINNLLDGSADEREKAINNLISIKQAFIFIFHQIHKYIFMAFTFFFLKYSIYYLVYFFKGVEPMWVYFKQQIAQKSEFHDILFSLSLSFSFILSKIEENEIGTLFCLVYNEIIFFILTTFIIYLGYKYKFRVDSLILFIILFMFIGKMIYYLLQGEMITFKYYSLDNFGKFEISIYFNYVYYLLGVYFSFGNYTIQKGIVNYEDAEKEQKPYLFIFVKFTKKFKKMQKGCLYGFGSLLILVVILFSFIETIMRKFLGAKDELLESKAFSVLLLFDCDLCVAFIHLFALIFYIKGDNVINTLFTLPIWSYFNKIYFMFILTLNPIIIYLIYQSETRIKFDIANLTFYSILTLFLLSIVSSFFYIAFELPYKRILRIIFSKGIIDKNVLDTEGNLYAPVN